MIEKNESKVVIDIKLLIGIITLLLALLTASVGATVTAVMWRADLQNKVIEVDTRLSSVEEWKRSFVDRGIPEQLATINQMLENIQTQLGNLKRGLK